MHPLPSHLSTRSGFFRLLAFTFATLLFSPGCHSPEPSSPPALPLAGTRWTLVGMRGQPLAAIDGFQSPTLQLDAATRRASGSSGVNRFSTSFELSGPNLKFGLVMGTRMAGPPPAMEAETAFLTALSQVSTWEMRRGLLDLKGPEGLLLEFKPAP